MVGVWEAHVLHGTLPSIRAFGRPVCESFMGATSELLDVQRQAWWWLNTRDFQAPSLG